MFQHGMQTIHHHIIGHTSCVEVACCKARWAGPQVEPSHKRHVFQVNADKCKMCQLNSLGFCNRHLHRGGADTQLAPVSRLISGYLSTLRRPNAMLGAASSPLPSSCLSSEDAPTCPCLTAGPNSLLSASDSLFTGAAAACCCPCQPDGPATSVLETGWPAVATLPSTT